MYLQRDVGHFDGKEDGSLRKDFCVVLQVRRTCLKAVQLDIAVSIYIPNP